MTNKKTLSIQTVLFILFFQLVFSSCSSIDQFGVVSPDKPKQDFPSWFTWSNEISTEGNKFYSARLSDSQDALWDGDTLGAIKIYDEIISDPEAELEKKEALYRKVAVILGQTKGQGALKILTQYFKSTGVSASKIDGYPALLLGHAYRQIGNTTQSLAWFSRSRKSVPRNSIIADAATKGAKTVVVSVVDEDLQNLKNQWSNDFFILAVISNEENKRLNDSLGIESKRNFSIGSPHIGRDPGLKLVAILPTTGRYGELGRSTRKGIEIIARQIGEATFSVTVIDSGQGISEAAKNLKYLIESGRVDGIIGPLVSSYVTRISSIARAARVPMIHLAKRDDSDTGKGVFRLGMTNESQVLALARSAAYLGLRNVAVVCVNGKSYDSNVFSFESLAPQYSINISSIHRYMSRDSAKILEIASTIDERDSIIDSIFFCGTPSEAIQLKTALSSQLRNNIKFLAMGSWYDISELKHFQSGLDGSLIASPFFSESVETRIMDFNNVFKDTYGHRPDFLAAQGFDAGFILVEALRKSKREGYQPIRSIYQLPVYNGLTGVMSVKSSGEIARKLMVVQLESGQLHPVNY